MSNIANFPKKTTGNNKPGVALVDIRPGRCRWPLSDDPRDGLNFRFCAKRTISAKSSWCAQHRDEVFRAREVRLEPRRFFAEAAE